ncbi:transcription factor DIVARICATA-like [Capsicum annuum]|uniref:transcription factor DIVARICATA-like n=1 Tax=Capsicum annuum TaxID=4072 RepID=UPI0007BEFC9D|nr:transcription factor DIVARICATA-like [Capsicum annuum]
MREVKSYYIAFFKNVEMENSPENNDVFVVSDDDGHDQQHHLVQQEDNHRPCRRRGTPWTKNEHQLFLMGLNRFKRGDWKSISRYYVVSKTPTQVASHAQKYFSRQDSKTPVERRRPSINDIQTVNLNLKTAPITTMGATYLINNNRFAYNNNHQAASSSIHFHHPSYTFSGPTFSNNFNENFEISHLGETSGSNSSVMGKNNNNNNFNNLNRPVSPRPFLSTYLSSIRTNDPQV